LDEIVIKDINTGDVVEVLLGFLLYVEKSNTHKNLLFHKLGIYSSEIPLFYRCACCKAG
jgi:hypothetical protein